ncbi:MAG: outer membrane beta-barrel protein [Byssovorax sp.]
MTVLFVAPLSARAEGAPVADTAVGKFTLGGYLEAAYSYNLGNPGNGITAYRGFDDRHNSFTISNAVLDGLWEKDAVSGRILLQVGQTPDSYYQSEPRWKYLQQAYLGYKAPLGRGLLLQAGLFLSPIGVEAMAVKDNWSWSRSNLFFGLPFYHLGIRATQQLTGKLSVTAAVYNGWNDVIDNNPGKSVSVQFAFNDAERLLFSVLYFGGPERLAGAPEGQPWRHLLDGWAQVHAAERLWLGVHGDAGFEVNRYGISTWAAGALYAQVKAASFLYFAARGDYFHEHAAANGAGRAARLFWPGVWVASATGTVDVRPRDNILLRAEIRHDRGQTEMFFKGPVEGDGSSTNPYAPNARAQSTVTLGVTTWL